MENIHILGLTFEVKEFLLVFNSTLGVLLTLKKEFIHYII